jgi:AraC-like DNA-binding protein
MSPKLPKALTDLERDAIEIIERLRGAHGGGLLAGDIGARAEFLHDLLAEKNGNAKLRLSVLYRELGCTERSMEREFVARYHVTAHAFQENLRIAYAKRTIEMDPNVKITALASELGYSRESEFQRFFYRKEGVSPRAFRAVMKRAAARQRRGAGQRD